MACTAWYATSQIITWLLVIGGWIYVNSTNNSRESRKELRAAVDKLQRDVDVLIETAQAYYRCGVQDGKAIEPQILVRFSRLGSALQHLGDKHSEMKSGDLTRKMSHLMDQVTGDDFQSAARAELTEDSQKLVNIAAAAMDVQNELETLFIHMTK